MHYRDTKTGRFVSATTWKRSRAHGGTRFKRVRATRAARGTVRPATFPTETGGDFVLRHKGKIQNVPQEFLDFADFDFFEAGYEADEEDEY